MSCCPCSPSCQGCSGCPSYGPTQAWAYTTLQGGAFTGAVCDAWNTAVGSWRALDSQLIYGRPCVWRYDGAGWYTELSLVIGGGNNGLPDKWLFHDNASGCELELWARGQGEWQPYSVAGGFGCVYSNGPKLKGGGPSGCAGCSFGPGGMRVAAPVFQPPGQLFPLNACALCDDVVCPGIYQSLTALFTNKTGSCTCLPDAARLDWFGDDGNNGNNWAFNPFAHGFDCLGNEFSVTLSSKKPDRSPGFGIYSRSGGAFQPATSVMCNPLVITFSNFSLFGPMTCSGTVDITIMRYDFTES